MQKFSGCLWEVVLCKWLLMRIEPQGSLLRRGPYTSPDTFLAQNLLSATSNVRIRVAPCCHWNFFIYSGVIVHTANLDTTPLACVAWQFWLGVLSNKGGWGQRNCGEIGEGATWNIFLAASACVPGWTKPPCYTGYHTVGQVPAYKRLKTIENYKIVRLISGHGHLLEVFIYKRLWSWDLTGKILVFWIDGCFMGGGRLRNERWWHFEVQLYGEFAERSRHFFFLSSHVLMMSMFDRMWVVILQSNLMAPFRKGKSGHLMDSGFFFTSLTDNFSLTGLR